MKNDLSAQFDSLNKEIVLSINTKNYARATLLDQARQKMLHDLASSDIRSVDAEFFFGPGAICIRKFKVN
jgi:hypothetical protein